MIIINFKTYEQGTGENALKLAKICEEIARDSGAEIILAVQPTDISLISQNVSLKVFAQHIDDNSFGSHTGSITSEAVKRAGAVGTLINHSEKHLILMEVEKRILRAKEAELTTIVCAKTSDEAKEIAKFHPDFIAIEPPELIGGEISVASAKPELISSTIEKVNEIKEIPVLAGAGIKNSVDVKVSLELGAKGILVASGVVKSKDIKESLKGLIDGFNK